MCARMTKTVTLPLPYSDSHESHSPGDSMWPTRLGHQDSQVSRSRQTCSPRERKNCMSDKSWIRSRVTPSAISLALASVGMCLTTIIVFAQRAEEPLRLAEPAQLHIVSGHEARTSLG